MASSIFYSQNLAPDQYINWGITSGSNGYGIRDNAGTIEFKDTGGSWAPISSSSSGGGWQRVGTVVSLVTGTDTIGSNLRPTDATYVLGDDTHGWLGARFHSAGTDDIVSITQADESPYALTFNNTTGSGFAGLYVDNDGVFSLDTNDVGFTVANGAFNFGGSLAGSRQIGNAQSSSGMVSALLLAGYVATDLTAADAVTNTAVVGVYGQGGVASIGAWQNFASNLVVSGSGSALNEYTANIAVVRNDLGTGYTQTTGPTGRTWLADWAAHGPIALQPNALNGITLLVNEYYNGSPADSPAGGLWITTQRGAGAGTDVLHAAAATYPIDVGIGIVGVSNAGSDAIGFTTALQIGGSGSPWEESVSKIGTGVDIRDYSTAGISLHNQGDTAKPDVKFTGFFEGTEMTAPVAGAANTGRIFFQDNGGGKTQLMVIFNTGAAQQIAIQP